MGISQIGTKFVSRFLSKSVCTRPINLSKINTQELRLTVNKADSTVVRFMQPTTPLTKAQILNMKPTEFTEMLSGRTDVPKELKDLITSPEKLGLYDELNSILAAKKLPSPKRKSLLETFLHGNVEADAQRDVLPKLIEKGYDIDMLSKLHIRDHNKNQVEFVLGRKDVIIAEVESHIQKKLSDTKRIVTGISRGNQESIDRSRQSQCKN